MNIKKRFLEANKSEKWTCFGQSDFLCQKAPKIGVNLGEGVSEFFKTSHKVISHGYFLGSSPNILKS